MIIDQTYRLLRSEHGSMLEELTIADVRVGQFLTAVRLSDGSIGTASSLEDDHPFCSKAERDFGEFTPLKIKGRNITELFETGKQAKLVCSLRTAALNAISSKFIESGRYRLVENSDPIDLLELGSEKNITVVGAFQSYIQKISETANRLSVLEFNEGALRPEQKKYYVPANEFRSVIPSSDIVIITGQTLVNNTLEGLLSEVKPGTEVIVTGPSGSIFPDVLFKYGVTIIGASRFTKPDLVFDLVGEAGMGYHLYRYCAQKICILRDES